MLEGTLTIRGPLEQIAEITAFIRERWGDAALVDAPAQPLSWQGWSEEVAALVYATLAAPQQRLIREVVQRGGHIDEEGVRTLFGDSLRGTTGPIAKKLTALTKAGRVPADLPRPVRTRYPQVGYQRIIGLEMDAELVAIFTRVLQKQ